MDYLENAQVSHRTATLKPCDRPIYEVDKKVYLFSHIVRKLPASALNLHSDCPLAAIFRTLTDTHRVLAPHRHASYGAR